MSFVVCDAALVVATLRIAGTVSPAVRPCGSGQAHAGPPRRGAYPRKSGPSMTETADIVEHIRRRIAAAEVKLELTVAKTETN